MVRFTRRRALVCGCLTGALLVGQLAACTTWRTQSTPPQHFTVRDSTQLVRVVRRNGTQVTLQRTRVSGDTLYGTTTPDLAQVLAIPLSDVQTLAVRERDTGKVVVIVVGAGLFGLAALFLYVFVVQND